MQSTFTRLFCLLLLFGSATGFTLAQTGGMTEVFSVSVSSFDLAIGNGYLYVQPTNSSILPYDLATLTVPAAKPAVAYTGSPNSLLESDGAYLYGAGGSDNTFRIWDISTPDVPVLQSGSFNLSFTFPSSLLIAGNYAYLSANDSIFVVDITNKTAPSFVGGFTDVNLVGSTVNELLEYAGSLYVATSNGIFTYSLATPSMPAFLSTFTADNSLSISVDSMLNMLVSGRATGLTTYDLATGTAISGGTFGTNNGVVHASDGFILQPGANLGSSQSVYGFQNDLGLPILLDTVAGSVSFNVRDIKAVSNIFYVGKFGGFEVYELDRFVAVDTPKELQFTVSPNPGNGAFRIGLTAGITSAELQVFDLQGGLIRRQTLDQINTEIALEGLAAGSYFVQVTTAGLSGRRILVVQ